MLSNLFDSSTSALLQRFKQLRLREGKLQLLILEWSELGEKFVEVEKSLRSSADNPQRQKQLEIIVVHRFWCEIYEEECSAAVAYDKLVNSGLKATSFSEETQEAPTTLDPQSLLLWKEVAEKLLKVQQAWKLFMLATASGFTEEQVKLWKGQTENVSKKYPYDFKFWRECWRNAVDFLYLTREAKRDSRIRALSAETPTATEDDRAELWTQLLEATRHLRRGTPADSIEINQIWTRLFEEIKFLKVSSVHQETLSNITLLKNTLQEKARLSLISYEKKRRETPVTIDGKVMPNYRQEIVLKGANVAALQGLCETWRRYKEELKSEEKFGDLMLYIASNSFGLEDPERLAEECSVSLSDANLFALSALKWRTREIEELIRRARDPVPFVEGNSSIHITTQAETNLSDIDDMTPAVYRMSETRFDQWDRLSVDSLKKASKLISEVLDLYPTKEIAAWRPEFPLEKMEYRKFALQGNGFSDQNEVIFKETLPLNYLLHDLGRFPDVAKYKTDLEEMLSSMNDSEQLVLRSMNQSNVPLESEIKFQELLLKAQILQLETDSLLKTSPTEEYEPSPSID